MKPEDPLGCLHRAYFMHGAAGTADPGTDYKLGTGGWGEVGRYLKFQPGLHKLADDLLRYLLKVPPGQSVPPVSLHLELAEQIVHGSSYTKSR
jgi:hypothetical protein